MSAVHAPALRRSLVLSEWGAFFLQVLIAISFEVGDDLGRGLFAQHGTWLGIRNAQEVVTFEATHGFWIEPGWQTFFLQTHHLLLWTITSLDVAHLMNAIYVGGHVFVTLGVAVWVYFTRRRYFALLRNTIMLTNGLALIVYESFPVAPPRLTSGLFFQHHPFVFQDTVFGVLTRSGQLISSGLAYNEFSAMPSVHIGWALVAGCTVALLARSRALRIAGLLYPAVMLVAVVVTGNHYLLDAAGAVVVVAAAVALSLAAARLAQRETIPIWVRTAVTGAP